MRAALSAALGAGWGSGMTAADRPASPADAGDKLAMASPFPPAMLPSASYPTPVLANGTARKWNTGPSFFVNRSMSSESKDTHRKKARKRPNCAQSFLWANKRGDHAQTDTTTPTRT